jgi:hypothetical protein
VVAVTVAGAVAVEEDQVVVEETVAD